MGTSSYPDLRLPLVNATVTIHGLCRHLSDIQSRDTQPFCQRAVSLTGRTSGCDSQCILCSRCPWDVQPVRTLPDSLSAGQATGPDLTWQRFPVRMIRMGEYHVLPPPVGRLLPAGLYNRLQTAPWQERRRLARIQLRCCAEVRYPLERMSPIARLGWADTVWRRDESEPARPV